jgi:hypothetical protein
MLLPPSPPGSPPPNVVLLQRHRRHSRSTVHKVHPPHRQPELVDLEACNLGRWRVRQEEGDPTHLARSATGGEPQ